MRGRKGVNERKNGVKSFEDRHFDTRWTTGVDFCSDEFAYIGDYAAGGEL
ncbi:MAG: hypothetical protein V4714_07060 [Bacteroidota bacterium]